MKQNNMFDNLKKIFKSKDDKEWIVSPMEGRALPISEVNDPTFSQEILGKGVAILPSKGRVVSPVNGTIGIVFETMHALSIVSDQGAEILIHIGLDTVNLKGEFFKAHKKAEDKVKAGDLLLEFDLDKIKEAGYDVISPIVICNSTDYSNIETVSDRKVQPLDQIIGLTKY